MQGTDEAIKKIIAEKTGLTETEISNYASFTNDLGVDSLDVMEIIVEMEKNFSISIPDEDAERLTTVGLLINYIEEHKN